MAKITKNLAGLITGIGLFSVLSFNSYAQKITNPDYNISYEYDNLKRVIKEKYSCDENNDYKTDYVSIIGYKYDSIGNVAEITCKIYRNKEDKTEFLERTNYKYDSLKRIIEEKCQNSKGNVEAKRNEYDEMGRLVEINYETKNSEGKVIYAKRTTYEYDKNGNIIATMPREDINGEGILEE